MNNNFLTGLSPLRVSMAFIAMFACILYAPQIVMAAVALGEIGQNVAQNAKGAAKGIMYFGFTMATGMFFWGGFELYKASKQGSGGYTYPGGFIKIGVAMLILGASAVISSFSATLFGSDQTTGLNELGLR
jgi:uncharacterized membrane protein